MGGQFQRVEVRLDEEFTYVPGDLHAALKNSSEKRAILSITDNSTSHIDVTLSLVLNYVVTPYSSHVIPFIPAGRTVADMIWKP